MTLPAITDRRTVLRTLGTAAVGATGLSGTAVARGNLVAKINSSGHYARFPLGPETWARSKNPFDIRQNGSRWAVKPAARGSVRCLVTDLPAGRNAGFDVHVGPLGNLEKVTIDAETVRTARDEDTAELFVGLYLDAGDDDDFFAWTDGRGNTDRWVGFGVDGEGVLFTAADGEITIDGDTAFQLFNVGSGPNAATLAQLQNGDVTGFKGNTIDEGTDAAVYVGVASAGEEEKTEEARTEEVLVKSVTVERA